MFWEKHGIEKKDLLMPGSILVGALLISASIFWGGPLVGLNQGTNNEAGTGNAPSAQQNQNNDPVDLSVRKDAPSRGDGKVEIVEFSDFQCPFCQRFYSDAYKQIKAKYVDTGKAKFVFRHFPLSFHQNAQKAAEAAECANRQGKFWPYHDLLFDGFVSDGSNLEIPDLKKYASDLGLDTGKFNTCLDNGETAAVVKKDIDDATKAGVSGTPTLFINGKKIVGAQPFNAFEAVVEEELK
jgi:protein-disulfide isomerase